MKYEWPPFHIAINLTTQNLQLLHSEEEDWICGDMRWSQTSIIKDIIFETKISSAEKGFGQVIDSFKRRLVVTMLGRRLVKA